MSDFVLGGINFGQCNGLTIEQSIKIGEEQSEYKEILLKQLRLLQKESEKESIPADLCRLSEAMAALLALVMKQENEQ